MLMTPTSPPSPSRVKRLEAVDSSVSSDRCKDYPNHPECQKPVSTNAITIVVAIVVPVVVILIVLGALWYINWRKNRKEDMDHDPDFDENGEATALPDFLPPRFHSGPGQPEDPFSNSAASARSFPKPQYRSATMTTADATSIVGDPYLEDFVLPYLHQTNSKISLNEYARQLGDSNSYGYSHSHSPSGTSQFGSRPALISAPRTDSPQKSHLLRLVLTSLPPVMQHERGYNPLLNNLRLSVDRPTLNQDVSSNLTDSHGAGILYENESLSQIGKLDSAGLSFANAELDSREDSSLHSRGDIATGHFPFQSHYDDAENTGPPPPLSGHDPNFHGRRSIAHQQQQDTAQHDEPLLYEQSREHNNGVQSGFSAPISSSEDTSNSVKVAAMPNEGIANGTGPKLLEEQIEDLQRLKSVYRVYFDKNDGSELNTKSSHLQVDSHDENAPPGVGAVNRSSMASSVYPDAHDVTRESHLVSQNEFFTAEHGYDPHAHQGSYQGLNQVPLNYQHEPLHFHNHALADERGYLLQGSKPPHEPVNREPVYQAPLKQLKNASDHRMSSIETFTDFEPKHNRVGLPRPGMPSGGDLNWDGSFESPALGATLGVLGSTSNLGQVPSASQLARQLVVMVDPVAGIPYQKGFKPAGSLLQNPKTALPQMPDHHNFGAPSSLQSDLIPGNRKSDVRRMMNTNF